MYDIQYSFILNIFFMKSLLFKSMVVSEGSYSFEMWSDLPMPMYMRVYYFNCTNHLDVQNHKAKPL